MDLVAICTDIDQVACEAAVDPSTEGLSMAGLANCIDRAATATCLEAFNVCTL